MQDEKPPYLADQPKERSGIYTIIAILLVLAVAIYGALKIYAGTVDGWNKRFNSPPSQLARGTATHEQHAHHQMAPKRLPTPVELTPDKCIDGIAFKRLPDGGWENIKGISCIINSKKVQRFAETVNKRT